MCDVASMRFAVRLADRRRHIGQVGGLCLALQDVQIPPSRPPFPGLPPLAIVVKVSVLISPPP